MAGKNEAIVIVLDVGPNTNQLVASTGDTFLKSAQVCATKIIQRKILSDSKDEIGIILLGSEETNNTLADDENYSHIEVIHPLQLASWRMVHNISKYKKCTPVTGDWFDALIVAADYMKTATQDRKFKEKKIVLLTCCSSEVNDAEIDDVIKSLENEEVQVIVIGPEECENDWEGAVSKRDSIENLSKGLHLMRRICREVPKSVVCGFEDAISQLTYFELKRVRPTPWKTTLTLGSEVKIPIVAYKKIAETKRMTFQNIIIKPPENTASSASSQVLLRPDFSQNSNENGSQLLKEEEDCDITLVGKDRTYQTVGNDATPIDELDVIEGYMFGTTIVPVTDADLQNLAYHSGPRCLSILGFTHLKNIPPHFLKGNGCYQVFPENEENCKRAFSALIQAMDSKDMVAVVRKVYNANNLPVVCALMPFITAESQCFVLIELPYAEDLVNMLFPPLVPENKKPTADQLQAVDHFIMSMDLMKVHQEDGEDDEDSELYNPLRTLDPYEQHFFTIVAKKALEGEHVDPREVSECVKELLAPRHELVQAVKPHLDRIKKQFPLQEVPLKEGTRKAAADVFKQDNQSQVVDSLKPVSKPTDTVCVDPVVGTVQPQNDFDKLLDQGVSFEKACELLTEVITVMVSKAFDDDDYDKPFKCLLHLRIKCIKQNPVIFNEWIMKFKRDHASEKNGFWNLLVKGGAGLITVSESDKSTVECEEAKSFFQLQQNTDDGAQTSLDEDMDDLINQM